MRESSLCYLIKNNCYLMLHRVKKKNDVNRDKWIGIGGGMLEGETPTECAIRETQEETGYTMHTPLYRGVVYFSSDVAEDEIMHLFTCDNFSGEEIECDEGELLWVPIEKVPSLPTWEGDHIFLDLLSQNTPFFTLHLRYCGERLISHNIIFA